jgi:hypothetical protein
VWWKPLCRLWRQLARLDPAPRAREPSAFTTTIQQLSARHRTIPPGQHRCQSDVETVHSLMELELYL